MKPRRVILAVLLLAAFGGACATSPAPTPTAVGGYSAAQVGRILSLREAGESLAAVAQRVGGTRAEVRIVERQYRIQQHQGSVASPSLAIQMSR
jgi:hypothetical protein